MSTNPTACLGTIFCSGHCPWAKLFAPLIQEAVRDELTRVADEERAQWATAFGDGAPTDPKEKQAKIIRIASLRATLSIANGTD